MKIVKGATLSVVVLAAAALLPGSAVAQETVRVASLRTFAMMPFYYAEQEGYFKDEGLAVRGITLNNGPAAISAVVSGSAEMAESAIVPVILARAHNQPVKIFLSLNYEQYPKPIFDHLIATQRSGVTTLAGLKGKTVAINASSAECEFILRDHLQSVGLTEKSVKLITIPFPQMPAALELGEADAACLVDPFFTAVMRSPKDKATLLAGSVANLKELGRRVLDGYYARADWLEANPKTAAAFMRAIAKADHELVANPPLYRKLLVDEFKVPEALAEAMSVELNPVDFVARPADYQAAIDGLIRTKLLAKSMPAADVIHQIKP